jgi:hypothetical protein
VTRGACPVCDAEPRIGVAITHPALRMLVSELIGRDLGRKVEASRGQAGSPPEAPFDLLILDSAGFEEWRPNGSVNGTRTKVVVVGPEPDPSYREVALLRGADSWVASDRIAEELRSACRRVLGCPHVPLAEHVV